MAEKTKIEQPTFIERFVSLIPLPYPLAAAIWTVVLGPPAIVLLNLANTRDLGQSLKSFFPVFPPGAVWQQVLAVIFWYFMCWYGFLMVRYILARVQAAEKEIAPLLPGGQQAYRRAFRQVSRPLGSILIGLFLCGVFIRTSLIVYRNAAGPLMLVWRTLYPHFFYFVFGAGAWMYISALGGLIRLGKQGLNLRPYHADNMMGLRAIGSLSLSVSSAFFGLLAITTIQLLFGPVVMEYLVTLGILVVLGVVLFFLPLNHIHRLMIKEKSRLRTEHNARVVRAIEKSGGAGRRTGKASGSELAGAMRDIWQVLVLELSGRKLDTLAAWPFDTRILGKLSAIVLSVIAGLILNVLVKKVLKI